MNLDPPSCHQVDPWLRLHGHILPHDVFRVARTSVRVQAVSATPRLLRAIAIAVTFALAFGLTLSHGYWMPIAAIVAMKASLDQTTIAAAQRVADLLAKRTAKAPPRPATQPA